MAEYKGSDLRAYIFDLLQGNVTYNAVTVPVANRAYNGITFPHILVSLTGTSGDIGTKDFLGKNYNLTVEIVTRFRINEGGQDALDDICNSVLSLLSVRSNTRRFGNSFMVAFRYNGDVTIEEEDEQFRYEFRRINFEAEIHQDNQSVVIAGDILQGDLQLDLNGS